MDWNCTLTEERLSEYLEGSLSPDERAAFSGHVASCVHCSQLVARVSGLVKRVQRLALVEEPPHLAAKILDATLGPRISKRGWEWWVDRISVLWQPRFAVGMATAVASVIIVFHTAGLTPTKLKKADLSPANVLRAANRQAHLTYARSVKFVNDLRVVYEIQTRLQPEQEQSANPGQNPAPQNESQPPSSSPDQKTQTEPRPGRTQVRSGSMFAFVVTNMFTRSLT
jgi:anti-sigma factor RsiW